MRSEDMKKFKKFLEKNKVYIIIGVLAVLFIVLSLLVKDSDIKNKNDEKVTEWYSTTKEGGVVVTVLAQTTCSHCINFKPIMNSVQKEYGFKLYWFELDQVSSKSYTMLTNTYDIYSSFGTPYIFITNNGEFVADYQKGEMPKDELITFLKENGVIKSDSED